MSSEGAQIAIFATPILPGTLSFMASTTIICKILNSKTKLKSPYSRLIFGLSLYDVISSSCNIASTMPIPKEYGDLVFGAIGNSFTCKVQGTLFAFSVVCTTFYNAALCIYYFSVIKYTMKDRRFSRLIEPYLHLIPLFFSIASSVFLLQRNYINYAGTLCWIDSDPRGSDTVKLVIWILSGIPLFLIFVVIVVLMGIITWIVWRQEKKMDQYRFFQSEDLSPQSSIQLENHQSNSRNHHRRRHARHRTRVRAVKTQANLYFWGFILTYGPAFLYRLAESSFEKGSVTPPLAFILLSRFFHPLQGVFNLIAHLQPRVSHLRRTRTRNNSTLHTHSTGSGNSGIVSNNKDKLSWLRAFWIAIQTYDDALDRNHGGNPRVKRRSTRLISSISITQPARNYRTNHSSRFFTIAEDKALGSTGSLSRVDEYSINTDHQNSSKSSIDKGSSHAENNIKKEADSYSGSQEAPDPVSEDTVEEGLVKYTTKLDNFEEEEASIVQENLSTHELTKVDWEKVQISEDEDEVIDSNII
mmetsp:Transcript_19519/g.29368  ORF Transcript_19519/g.29368 Transcript_19519/m.29368 type:complete len:528 (-) Transcript_19519:113-1696(-)